MLGVNISSKYLTVLLYFSTKCCLERYFSIRAINCDVIRDKIEFIRNMQCTIFSLDITMHVR